MLAPLCASLQASARSATTAGKIAEAAFPRDVHPKVQTPSGTLIRRSVWPSIFGILQTLSGNWVVVPGNNLGAAQGWLGTRKRNRSNDLD